MDQFYPYFMAVLAAAGWFVAGILAAFTLFVNAPLSDHDGDNP